MNAIKDVASSGALSKEFMISTTFYELFDSFMGGARDLHPQKMGVDSFSRSELVGNSYELVGDASDFHFYEKAYDVPYHNRKVIIVFKYYFNGEVSLGAGLSVGDGVRLTALLKKLLMAVSRQNLDDLQLSFFFSDDRREGAVIFDDRLVVRFDQWGARNAYMVSTFECDFVESELFGAIAKNAVKDSLESVSQSVMKVEVEAADKPSAYLRLVKILQKYFW
ncbi:hypothetical protein [Pseudomonas allokribbensis]|uniref:hypothetical protein n=1 Tax=Pseudomonas allokribbensis TaxID=2774460 RepID=UPI00178846D9|nr:hypothetical protein [Pseudomonas allokribbensis]